MTGGRSLGPLVIALWAAAAACELNPLFDPTIAADSSTEVDPTAGTGSPAIDVGELRAGWTTPNQIRWDWDASGEQNGFFAYELVVGPSEQDVLDESEATYLWTSADNPELAHYLLPKTGGADPVVSTTTVGHDPDTVVYARLRARDTAGGVSYTNVAQARTTVPPSREIVLIADADTPGYSIPAEFVLSNDRPYAGPSCYRWQANCGGEPECWENLRRQEMSLDLSQISTGNYLTTAHLELALAVEGTATTWWCDVYLWYDGSSTEKIASYNAWTAKVDGEYHLLQVPLRVLAMGDTPAPPSELAFGLFGFNVGCLWSDGAVVRVDEMRIRW